MPRSNVIKLAVQGRRLVIKDAAIMLYAKAAKPEWPWIEMTPGEYMVSLKKNKGKVAGIQIMRAGETKIERGKVLGHVAVDHGAVAVCDYDTLLPLTKSHPAEYADWTSEVCEKAIWEESFGLIEFKGSRIAHAKTGVGDGDYPVFALVSGKRTVGLECAFVPKAKKAPPLRPSRYTQVELMLHGIRDRWCFCDDRTFGASDLELILFDLEFEVQSAMHYECFGEAPPANLDQAIAKQVKRFRGLRKIEVFDEINNKRVLISDQMVALLSSAPTGQLTTPRQLARFIHKIFRTAAAQNPV